MLHQELSNKIIKAYYNVYNGLGYEFLFHTGKKAEFRRKIFTNDKK